MLIQSDGVSGKSHINADSTVIYLGVEDIFLPHEIRHWELRHLAVDVHFSLDISLVICLEHRPLVGSIGWFMKQRLVADIFVGNTKISDESLALEHLLLLDVQHLTNTGKMQRKSEIGRSYHCTPP